MANNTSKFHFSKITRKLHDEVSVTLTFARPWTMCRLEFRLFGKMIWNASLRRHVLWHTKRIDTVFWALFILQSMYKLQVMSIDHWTWMCTRWMQFEFFYYFNNLTMPWTWATRKSKVWIMRQALNRSVFCIIFFNFCLICLKEKGWHLDETNRTKLETHQISMQFKKLSFFSFF